MAHLTRKPNHRALLCLLTAAGMAVILGVV